MSTKTITLNISSEIDDQLDRLASESGHDKNEIAAQALIEWIENVEDVRDALDILERTEPTSDIAEVRQRLGLER